MSNEILEDYEERQKKRALKLLKELERRVKRGQLKVISCGYWEGTQGKWNFNVVTRESDNFKPFVNVP